MTEEYFKYTIKVSNDTKRKGDLGESTKARIESELEIKSYIQDLKYALENGAKINFQAHRLVDDNKDMHYTNQYTVATLFPNENPDDVYIKIRVE